jgi:putative SOS response-associated peptidase YedK
VVYRPRYNLAPGDQHWMVVHRAGTRVIVPAKWGFPTDTSRLLINARVETAAGKPSFRDAYRKRRCLIPADGFYEWRHEQGKRGEPQWYHRGDGSLLLMAGLHNGAAKPAFTILTMPANDVVSPAHDRMPVVLSEDGARAWLDDPSFDPAAPATWSTHGQGLLATPVSSRVNSAAFDGPECLAAPEPAPPARQLRLV